MLKLLTLLLRQTTGHNEQPKVQQQHIQPQNSHFTLTGRVFLRTELILCRVSLNSSGATLPVRAEGNSVSKRLLSPNLQKSKLFINLKPNKGNYRYEEKKEYLMTQ